MKRQKSRAPRILWVEDNADFCREQKADLERLPARVTIFGDGNSAIDHLLEARPVGSDPYQLVILDMWVPRTKGEDDDKEFGLRFLAEQFRPFQLLPTGTPFIIYTGHPSYDHCVRSLKAGAYYYLPKEDEGTKRSNIGELLKLCRNVLTPKTDGVQLWLDEHLDEVMARHGGAFVGIIDEKTTTSLRAKRGIIGGRMLIAGKSIQEVRRKMLLNKILRWKRPDILKVPPNRT